MEFVPMMAPAVKDHKWTHRNQDFYNYCSLQLSRGIKQLLSILSIRREGRE